MPNSVSKLTAGLCHRGLLARHPLFPPAVYFTLGETAARDRGVRLHRAQPLGPQALPIGNGVPAYATLGPEFFQWRGASGGTKKPPQLSAEEVVKLKSLLNSI